MRTRLGPICSTAAHARNLGEVLGEPLPFRLHLDVVTAAEHLAAKFGDGAEQHDVALVEQRDAVADALHPLEQMRRQQARVTPRA